MKIENKFEVDAGIPTETTTYTLLAENINGSASAEVTITVNDVNTAPVLGAIGNQNVDEEELLTFTATVNDTDVPVNNHTFTLADGAVTIFAGIDHASADCIGIHAVKRANRFEALEPTRQGVKEHFGAFRKNASVGLKISTNSSWPPKKPSSSLVKVFALWPPSKISVPTMMASYQA